MRNPENHYHIIQETDKTQYIELCERGEKCVRKDSHDIFGGNITNLTKYKIVMGYKSGELIPLSSRYITSVVRPDFDETIHYYELSGDE